MTRSVYWDMYRKPPKPSPKCVVCGKLVKIGPRCRSCALKARNAIPR